MAEEKLERVIIYKGEEGSTSTLVDVLIDKYTGDIAVYGSDLGPDIREKYGDSDIEYWTNVKKEHKDLLLLYLIEEKFKNNRRAVLEFRKWCEEKGIPCEGGSYI